MAGYGRCERIRTSDPFLPKEVRYQTALHTVLINPSKSSELINIYRPLRHAQALRERYQLLCGENNLGLSIALATISCVQ